MKAVIAVVMLALGIVLGFTAGLVIRDPSVVTNPRALLQGNAPPECLRVVTASEELSEINREYLALVRDSYLPMLRQRHESSLEDPAPSAAGSSAAPAVDAMLVASQRLADLGDRTAAVTATLDESEVGCRARVRP
jgi:hypothetical protein